MNKQQQLNKMKELFKKEINFFKYIEANNPHQSLNSYKNTKQVNNNYTIILRLVEKIKSLDVI